MHNEHFGIAPVEMQSHGVILVAHKSGGPKYDIVTEEPESKRNGFLAETAEDYAMQMFDILQHYDSHAGADARLEQVQKNGFETVKRFSNQAFKETFIATFMSA